MLTVFGAQMPLHYKTYDEKGKLVVEGDFGFGIASSRLVGAVRLTPDWVQGDYAGPLADDPRDTGRFTLRLAPQHLPTADTVR